MVITDEKIEAWKKDGTLQGDINKRGVWVGFKIFDQDVKDKIKKGEYPMFSIGGNGTRELIEI
jgi:hypothetical protein